MTRGRVVGGRLFGLRASEEVGEGHGCGRKCDVRSCCVVVVTHPGQRGRVPRVRHARLVVTGNPKFRPPGACLRRGGASEGESSRDLRFEPW